MKQFEYLVKEAYQEQEDLNKLGAQGWELIYITESRYIYKREKQTEDEAKPNWLTEAKPNGLTEAKPNGLTEAKVEDEERKRIINALQTTNGNHKRAAELLGLSERTLHRRCKEYTIIFAKTK